MSFRSWSRSRSRRGPRNGPIPDFPAKFPFPLDGITAKPEYLNRLEKTRPAKKAAATPKVAKGPSVDDLLNDTAEKVDKTTSGKLAEELALPKRSGTSARSTSRWRMYRSERAARATGQAGDRSAQQVFLPRARESRLEDLVGRGFVEPVDDFRERQPAGSSPRRSITWPRNSSPAITTCGRWCKLVVTSDAYQRATPREAADEPTRAGNGSRICSPRRCGG